MADQENRQKDENPRENGRRERRSWEAARPYFAVGLTTIIVIFVAFAIFFFFYRFEGFSNGVGALFSSLLAVILGLILAYLLNPVMRFFERLLRKRMFAKTEKRTSRQNRVIRGLAVTIAMVCFLAVVTILLVLIVPRLISSVTELVLTLDEKLQTLVDWIERLVGNSVLAEPIESVANQAFVWLESWLETNILGAGGGDFIQTVLAGVGSVFRILVDFVIAIIVAVYVLMTKERFIGQGKKLIYAIFRPRAGNVIVQFFHRGDEVFGGFFVGKIIDSLIVGFICLAFMAIAHFPYVVLISVIIGVTNIIPVFGPFIGAIPSVILIFLVDPIYALYFIIFIIVLQQVDGNIIGPRILGNTTELSPFWIIFAILLFGGAFGIIGMIFGVPIFAMIYYVIKRIAEFILHRKELPEETMDYVYVENIDPDTHEITYRQSDDGRKAFSAVHLRKDRNENTVPPSKDNPKPKEAKKEPPPDGDSPPVEEEKPPEERKAPPASEEEKDHTD